MNIDPEDLKLYRLKSEELTEAYVSEYTKRAEPLIQALSQRNGSFVNDMIDMLRSGMTPRQGARFTCVKIVSEVMTENQTGLKGGHEYKMAWREIAMSVEAIFDRLNKLESQNCSEDTLLYKRIVLNAG